MVCIMQYLPPNTKVWTLYYVVWCHVCGSKHVLHQLYFLNLVTMLLVPCPILWCMLQLCEWVQLDSLFPHWKHLELIDKDDSLVNNGSSHSIQFFNFLDDQDLIEGPQGGHPTWRTPKLFDILKYEYKVKTSEG